jgi:DNA end-binding protein Ku
MKATRLYFGLVNVPVKFYKATEDGSIGFHQHHDKCVSKPGTGRIGYVKTCKSCLNVVDKDNIVRGIEDDNKNVVIITDDELASIAVEAGPDVEVIQFAHSEEIDPLAFENGYYLEPDGDDQSGYALLRQVLTETDRIAIVKFTLRGDKLHLGTLRVKGKYLVIHSMRWPNEVRDPSVLKVNSEVKIKPQQLKVAHMLVEEMLEPFNPAEFVDAYTERLDELIDAKAKNKKPKAKAAAVDLDEVDTTDILAALEASVARKKGRAGQSEHPAGKKQPAKKAAPRKAPARRRGAA